MAAKGNPSIAGVGGLIRSSMGRWLVGFQAQLGIYSSFSAELQALKMGLALAWEEGYRVAKAVIDFIQDADLSVHPLGCTIEDIKELISRAWQVRLGHSFREGNFCADKLANLACELDVEFERLQAPPSCIRSLLDADSWGVSFLRRLKT